jgi:hypothetical protein
MAISKKVADKLAGKASSPPATKRTAKRLQPTLSEALSKGHVHGSARRGRNASNRWFAEQLRAPVVASTPTAISTPTRPKRTWCCLTCGKEPQMCKARFPNRQEQYQR